MIGIRILWMSGPLRGLLSVRISPFRVKTYMKPLRPENGAQSGTTDTNCAVNAHSGFWNKSSGEFIKLQEQPQVNEHRGLA